MKILLTTLISILFFSCGKKKPVTDPKLNTKDSLEYVIKCDTTPSIFLNTENGNVTMRDEIVCDTVNTIVHKVKI
jgi:hypothetical protein